MRKLTEHPMEIGLKLMTHRNRPITERASLAVLLTGLSAEFASFCTDVKFGTDSNYGFEAHIAALEREIRVPATVSSRSQIGLGLHEYRLSFQFQSQDQFQEMYTLLTDLDTQLKKDPTYTNFHNTAIWELWMKRQNQQPIIK